MSVSLGDIVALLLLAGVAYSAGHVHGLLNREYHPDFELKRWTERIEREIPAKDYELLAVRRVPEKSRLAGSIKVKNINLSSAEGIRLERGGLSVKVDFALPARGKETVITPFQSPVKGDKFDAAESVLRDPETVTLVGVVERLTVEAEDGIFLFTEEGIERGRDTD